MQLSVDMSKVEWNGVVGARGVLCVYVVLRLMYLLYLWVGGTHNTQTQKLYIVFPVLTMCRVE